MKRVGELMAELGFREDAPESLKKALVEGLIKSLTPPEAARIELKKEIPVSKQMSFFEEEPATKPASGTKDGGKQAG